MSDMHIPPPDELDGSKNTFADPVAGTYGTITFHENTAIKRFTNIKIFYKELFYLSLFRRYKISQIITASSKDMTITMQRYDGSLVDLMHITNYEERLYLAGKIIRQILPVVHSLHSHGVAHKDITIANIFYNFDENSMGLYEFYLGDFSLMSVFNDTNYHTARCPKFPNLINLYSDSDIGATIQQTDLWMFGVTIWEFISKDRVVEHLSHGTFLDYKAVFMNAGISQYITDDIYQVLCALLRYNANERETTLSVEPIYKVCKRKPDGGSVEYTGILSRLLKWNIHPDFAVELCENAMSDSVSTATLLSRKSEDCLPIIDALSSCLTSHCS